MNRKFRLWQVNIFTLAVSVAALVGVILISFYFLWQSYYKSYNRILIQNSEMLKNYIGSVFDSKDSVQNICNYFRDENGFMVVMQKDGQIVASSKSNQEFINKLVQRVEVKNAISKSRGEQFTSLNENNTEKLYFVVTPIFKNSEVVGVLINSITVDVIKGQAQKVVLIFVCCSFLIIMIAVFFIFSAAKKFDKEITIMSNYAEQFAKGNFKDKILLPEIYELQALSNSLNKMAEQLDEKIVLINQQKNEIDAVLSGMAEAVLAVDLSGKIIRSNEAFAKLFGVTDSCNGKYFSEIVRNKDLEDYITLSMTVSDKSEERTVYLISQSLYMKANSSVLLDAMGEKYGVVIVLSDITRLKHLQKMRQEFVSNASHEIRTPITSIKGFVETILENGIDNKEETLHFLEIIHKQSDRLAAIINDLLLLSSLEEGGSIPLSPTVINDVILEAINTSDLYAKKKNIRIVFSSKALPMISGNAHLLEQALLNLIMNAITYSEVGSEVLVDVTFDQTKMQIAVKDNGIGIPASHLDRLFERFYRVDKSRSRKNGGTGLGLSIVKHIAQVHGGSVGVESIANKGSTFIITLPINNV